MSGQMDSAWTGGGTHMSLATSNSKWNSDDARAQMRPARPGRTASNAASNAAMNSAAPDGDSRTVIASLGLRSTVKPTGWDAGAVLHMLSPHTMSELPVGVSQALMLENVPGVVMPTWTGVPRVGAGGSASRYVLRTSRSASSRDFMDGSGI